MSRERWWGILYASIYFMYPVTLYFRQRYILSLSLVLIALLLLQVGLIMFVIGPRPDTVFLQYNILFGVNLRGEWASLLLIPCIGALISSINATIGWLLFDKDRFVAYLLYTMSVLCVLLLTVATFFIVNMNI